MGQRGPRCVGKAFKLSRWSCVSLDSVAKMAQKAAVTGRLLQTCSGKGSGVSGTFALGMIDASRALRAE